MVQDLGFREYKILVNSSDFETRIKAINYIITSKDEYFTGSEKRIEMLDQIFRDKPLAHQKNSGVITNNLLKLNDELQKLPEGLDPVYLEYFTKKFVNQIDHPDHLKARDIVKVELYAMTCLGGGIISRTYMSKLEADRALKICTDLFVAHEKVMPITYYGHWRNARPTLFTETAKEIKDEIAMAFSNPEGIGNAEPSLQKSRHLVMRCLEEKMSPEQISAIADLAPAEVSAGENRDPVKVARNQIIGWATQKREFDIIYRIPDQGGARATAAPALTTPVQKAGAAAVAAG